ncbi:MAG: sugar transferase, partial [Oxalobacteraceae bacterium]
VGPRPHPIAAKAGELLYWFADDRYRVRHSIKPGLTGLAQVRGFRGSTDRVEDLTNRLSADLEYLARWSISRDIWIILQTFGVLRHQNAF